MRYPKFSIIIPVKEFNDYLRKETIPAILKQTLQDFEIIVLPDKPVKEKYKKTRIISTWPITGPADKRDQGARIAKGDYLAFLDDDSYPQGSWLKNALRIFQENGKIAGVCGPSLTPPGDNVRQKASGFVWSTWLGSGGAGTYRCTKALRRVVDDFPTVNLLIKKVSFLKVGGFGSRYWPGEDTQLCMNIVKILGQKIIYDPKVVVYHHRREIMLPHLRQIARYALHRGHFARIFPQTSLKVGYILPSAFVLYLISTVILWLFSPLGNLNNFVLNAAAFFFVLYLFLLLVTGIKVFLQEKNCFLTYFVMITIFVTHIVYGTIFIKGFLTPKLKQ